MQYLKIVGLKSSHLGDLNGSKGDNNNIKKNHHYLFRQLTVAFTEAQAASTSTLLQWVQPMDFVMVQSHPG